MATGINYIFLWAAETLSLVQVGKVRVEESASLALTPCCYWTQKNTLIRVQMIFDLSHVSFSVTCDAESYRKDLHYKQDANFFCDLMRTIHTCPLQHCCGLPLHPQMLELKRNQKGENIKHVLK